MLYRFHILAILGTLLWLSGCATTRSEISVETNDGINSQKGMAVRIDAVKDARVFQIKPPNPDIPSLKDDGILNKAITSRAIARKRNTYGKGLGDVLLPEGQTVAGLTETLLRERSGSQVIEFYQRVTLTTRALCPSPPASISFGLG